MTNSIPLGLSYDDVLLVPQYSEVESRSDVDLTTQITPRVKLKLPLISVNMSDVTGVEMAIKLGSLGGLSFIPRFVPEEEEAEMVARVKKENVMVGAAIGIKDGYLERAEMLANAGADILTIDVAHGALLSAINATAKIKNRFGKKCDVVSGVVATYEGASDLFKAGADSVRVGVGPGTICITRVVTGVGVPQITAVIEASRAAKKFKKTVLCDGGTKNSGDIAKGLAAGASGVVIGSLFAGCDEAPGEVIKREGKMYKRYNASTSYSEKQKHVGNGLKVNHNYLNHIEGIESLVLCKGPVSDIVTKFEANLKASFSYSGAKNISGFWKRAKFVRVTNQGIKENGSHNVLTEKTKGN